MNAFPPATSSGLFSATICYQSQLAERKHVARYWSINTVVTAVPLIAHPSPIEILIQFDIPASIKLTLVIRTKLAAAILGGGRGLFGGNVLPLWAGKAGFGVLHYDTTPIYESYCQISFVFGVYFVWCPLDEGCE